MKIFRKVHLPYLQLCVLILEGIGMVLFKVPVLAQIAPDATLGAESSVVKNNATVKGSPAELIEGGAARGSNLFHSFQDFNVNNSQRVYFANPAGVDNILSRVTGGNASNILGTLGVDGAANLFLLNPNGIIFGKDARLDVSGSFVGSTAEGIKLGEDGLFSAADPSASQLIGVEPGALFHNALREFPGAIQNTAQLEVKPGQSLTLSGDKIINTGTLKAPGGIIALFGNEVNLNNKTIIDVSANNGGGTVLIGGDYQGTGTDLIAKQTFVGSNAEIKADAVENGDGGKVIVWADETTQFYGDISAKGGSESGDGGFVEVSGKENLAFDGFVDSSAEAGQNGTLLLDPKEIIIADGSGASNDEEIKKGDKTTTPEILADGDILKDDLSTKEPNKPNNIFTISEKALEEVSKTTDIHLEATNQITVKELTTDGKLDLEKGIKLHTTDSTETEGITFEDSNNEIITKGGKIHLHADGTGSLTNIGNLTSNGGDILLNSAKNIDIPAKSRLVSKGGHITLNAKEDITITETAPVGSIDVGSIDTHANIGGNITIKAGEIVTINGDSSVPFELQIRGIIGTIDTDSLANRPGGNITIDGKEIELNNARVTAESSNGTVASDTGDTVDTDPHDHGIPDITDTDPGLGKIEIGLQDKDNIVTINNSQVVSDSHGFHPDSLKGDASNAGDILIGNSDTQTNTIKAGSQITAEAHSHRMTDNDAGQAGSISVKGKKIEINGEETKITATTFGDGKGGDILIGNIEFDESDIDPNKKPIPVGNTTESIKIDGESLAEEFRPKIIAETSGASASSSAGGNIFVDANTVVFNNSLISSTTGKTVGESHELNGSPTGNDPETGFANAGNIDIKAGSLTIDGGEILSESKPKEIINDNGSGNAGNIDLNAGTIEIKDNANISSNSSDNPNSLSGDISLIAKGDDSSTLEAIKIDDSTIKAESKSSSLSDFSKIKIDASNGSVKIDDNSKVTATNSNIGNAGDIAIGAAATKNISIFNGSEVSSDGNFGRISIGENVGEIIVGKPLNIDIQDSQITTTNQGNLTNILRSGNIKINATEDIQISDISSDTDSKTLISSTTSGDGSGGSITITSDEGNITTIPQGQEINPGKVLILAQSDSENLTSPLDQSKGQAGSVTLNAEQGEILLDNVKVSSNAEGLGRNSGNIALKTPKLELRNNTEVTTETVDGTSGTFEFSPDLKTLDVNNSFVSSSTESGTARDITVTASESITLDGTFIPEEETEPVGGILSEATGFDGEARNITVETETLKIANNSKISTENINDSTFRNITIKGLASNLPEDENSLELSQGGKITTSTAIGQAGSIFINQGEDAADSVQLKGGTISATAGGEGGDAGNVDINTDSLKVQNGGEINTSTQNGTAGTVNIAKNNQAADKVEVIGKDSQIASEAGGTGNANNVNVNARQVIVSGENAKISTTNIAGNDQGSVTLRGLETDSTKLAEGETSLRVSEGGKITTSTAIGNAGSVFINKDETAAYSVNLNDGAIAATANENEGKAGNIDVNAKNVDVVNSSEILAENQNDNTSGQGNITFSGLNAFEVKTNSMISASTETGQAGNIDAQASDRISLNNATISSKANSTNGASGDITFSADGEDPIDRDGNTQEALEITDSTIEASSQNSDFSRDFSTISIEAKNNSVSLDNSKVLATNSGSAYAGDIFIDAKNKIDLMDQSQLSADGNNGQIFIGRNITPSTVTISKNSELTTTNKVTNKVDEVIIDAQAGLIDVKATGNIEVSEGSELSSTTFGNDSGGDITITSTEGNITTIPQGQNSNSNRVQILAQSGADNSPDGSSGFGTAGFIKLNATNTENGKIKLDNAQVSSDAKVSGTDSGSIALNTPKVELSNNTEVTTETVDGTSGTVEFSSELQRLDVNSSLISTSTQTGTAGNIQINASERVYLNDKEDAKGGGIFSNATDNDGTAGNITIKTPKLYLEEEADISAGFPDLEEEADISAGFPDSRDTTGIETLTAGNIDLQIDEQIRLSGLSDISTNGTSGGEIIIGSEDNEVGSILASRNSDIVATNIDGSLAEGRIDIFADIVLGLKQRDKRTGLNDVTSDSGDLESLEDATGVDTTELPDAPIDVASLIDRRCAIASDDQASSFTVTGKGGLPPNLRDSLSVPGLLQDFGFDDPNAENIEANNNKATFSLASQAQPLLTAENLPNYCLFSDNSSQ